MPRQEVYDMCTEKFYQTQEDYEGGICSARVILPYEAIDAIIDCAVEEAVARLKDIQDHC